MAKNCGEKRFKRAGMMPRTWENVVDHDPALAGVATDSHNKAATSRARLRSVFFYQTR